jgi:hypothetical protein
MLFQGQYQDGMYALFGEKHETNSTMISVQVFSAQEVLLAGQFQNRIMCAIGENLTPEVCALFTD